MTDLLTGLDAGVVIVSYHSHDLLRALVAATPWLDSPRTVVVDNAETGTARQALRDALAGTTVRIDPAGTNLGFGAACNRGVALLAGDGARAAILLNPDARLEADEARALVAAVRDDPTALVAPRVLDDRGGTWFAGGALDLRRGRAEHRPGALDWLTGACLAFDVERWRRVGGFDDAYFLYWEDVDLSARWRATGGTLALRDDVVATHAVGGTQLVAGGAGKSPVYLRYSCRNRLRYAARHLGRREQLRWLAASPRYAVRMWRRRRPGSEAAALRAVVGGTLAGWGQVLRP